MKPPKIKYKAGSKIQCISSYLDILTVNKIYDIVEFKDYGDCDEWNSFKADNGMLYIASHFQGYFILVEDLPKPRAKKVEGWGF